MDRNLGSFERESGSKLYRQPGRRARRQRAATARMLESLELRRLLTTFIVDTTADSGAGSFRQAILDANATAGADQIHFGIGTGAQTIAPISALPSVTDVTDIDATTQPGFAGTPLIELSGVSAGLVNGLELSGNNGLSGSGSSVRGLVINRFGQSGVLITGSGNTVVGNWIGVTPDGAAAAANAFSGVRVFGSYNTIGGAAAADRNVISGNGGDGVLLTGGSAYVNSVLGNYIGLNAAGDAALGNTGDGVEMNGTFSNIIGAPGAGNVIAGSNGEGIFVRSSSYCMIQGNFVGTDASGTLSLSNNIGIFMSSSSSIYVGGSIAGEGNLVSGNRNNGISNLNSNYNVIQGNFVGTKAGGVGQLSNGLFGVNVNATHSSTIGGISEGERNIICYNGAGGMNISSNASYNQVRGNWIGVDANGNAAGNSARGIQITTNASNNTIGGTYAGEGNRIAFNNGFGVIVISGVGNQIRGNSIYSNTGLGIDLSPTGVTANDLGDFDAGPNGLQNYPVLTAASGRPTGSTVSGTLNSFAYNYFEIDFFASTSADPSNFGEGQTYLGSTYAYTDASGNATFTASLAPAAVGQLITATATYYYGGTSEFSRAIIVGENQPPTAAPDAYTLEQGRTLYTYDSTGEYDSDPNNDALCANDSDPNGDFLTAIVVDGPAHGTLTLTQNGVFSYQPDADFYGTDTFTYKASDGQYESDAVTVTFTINKNEPPVAADEAYATNEETAFGTWDRDGTYDSDPSNDGVLANDTDSNGNWLTAVLVSGPSHGTLTLYGDGLFTYTPAEDFHGTDTFTYRASDGLAESEIATVTLTVTDPTTPGVTIIPDPFIYGQNAVLVIGTDADDEIKVKAAHKADGYEIKMNDVSLGTFNEGRIIIRGEAGDDKLDIHKGVSTPVMLFGESGSDHLVADSGPSILVGGGGDDNLVGGSNRDLLIGGEGTDKLVGGEGDDILIAGYTLYDNNYYTLCTIMNLWTLDWLPFSDRVLYVNYYYGYLSYSSAFDDTGADADALSGGDADDWYIYRSGEDNATGLSGIEDAYALLV